MDAQASASSRFCHTLSIQAGEPSLKEEGTARVLARQHPRSLSLKDNINCPCVVASDLLAALHLSGSNVVCEGMHLQQQWM